MRSECSFIFAAHFEVPVVLNGRIAFTFAAHFGEPVRNSSFTYAAQFEDPVVVGR